MDSEEVWDCFLMSGERMLHFLIKIDEYSFKIHQYYTIALSNLLFFLLFQQGILYPGVWNLILVSNGNRAM